jgi:hypothetical protein
MSAATSACTSAKPAIGVVLEQAAVELKAVFSGNRLQYSRPLARARGRVAETGAAKADTHRRGTRTRQIVAA